MSDFIDALKAPFMNFMSFQQPLSLPYLASTFILVAAFCVWRGKAHGFFSYLFPKDSWRHPSAQADYKFYIVGGIIMALVSTYVFFSSAWLNAQILHGLTAVFGPRQHVKPGVAAIILETVAYAVFFDLGYWISHWLMHKIPWLWELHKSHHSAEVLTPFTTLRTHPYEQIQSGNVIAVTTGAVYGGFSYIYGAAAQGLDLWQVNVLLMLFYGTFHNLRHSHIWLPVRGRLAYIIQSPAHHQIHHSTSSRHVDHNFGFCLSLWDWVFGTLYIPDEKQEKFKLGIGAESAEYHSVASILFLPFAKISRRIRSER